MSLGQQIHKIIHTMNKAEKRYFKLYTSKYGKSKPTKTAILFDAMKRLEVYDDKELQKMVVPKIKKTTLNYEKYRLKQQLLNALNDLHFNGKEQLSIGEIINKIELGFKLNMPFLIEEWLEKGYQLYDTTQDITLKVLLKKYEITLCNLKRISHEKISEHIEERLAACQELEKDLKFFQMKNNFSIWHYKSQSISKELYKQKINELIKNDFFNADLKDLTFRQSYYLLIAKGSYYTGIKDYEKATQTGIELLKLHQQLPEKTRLSEKIQSNYLTLIVNFIIDLLNEPNIEEAQKQLQSLQQLKDELSAKKKNTEEITQHLIFLEIAINAVTQNYHKTYLQKDKINEIVYEENSTPTKFFDSEMFVLILIEAMFAEKKYTECLENIERFYGKFSFASWNERMYIAIKIYECCNHFQLKNISNFNSAFNSIIYYVKKWKGADKETKNVLEMIKKLKSGKQDKIKFPIKKGIKERLSFLIAAVDWIEAQ